MRHEESRMWRNSGFMYGIRRGVYGRMSSESGETTIGLRAKDDGVGMRIGYLRITDEDGREYFRQVKINGRTLVFQGSVKEYAKRTLRAMFTYVGLEERPETATEVAMILTSLHKKQLEEETEMAMRTGRGRMRIGDLDGEVEESVGEGIMELREEGVISEGLAGDLLDFCLEQRGVSSEVLDKV